MVKRVINTRWSSHYESVKALQHCFLDVVCALNKNSDTRGQARGILDAIQQFSFVSFLQFWMEVLRESYDTQKFLLRRGLSLENCSHKMNAFIAFLVNDCNTLVKQSIETAIKICKKQEIPIEERRV